MIIDGEEWIRKPTSSAPETGWKAEYDKFCDGDCPRCIIFNTHRRDLRPCEIIWLQEYASVPVEKKEEYLVQIKEYLEHTRASAISDAERERETTSNEANDCARKLADVISLLCDHTTDKDDIPTLVFRMLDLTKEVKLARLKAENAVKNLAFVREKIKEGKL